MRHRHMSRREFREYKNAYKSYANDLEREHNAYFGK